MTASGTVESKADLPESLDYGEYEFSGSWVSPSYITGLEGETSEYTGRLYNGLVDEVKRGVSALTEMGYGDINIKGIFWMQGETDKNVPEEYKAAFK